MTRYTMAHLSHMLQEVELQRAQPQHEDYDSAPLGLSGVENSSLSASRSDNQRRLEPEHSSIFSSAKWRAIIASNRAL